MTDDRQGWHPDPLHRHEFRYLASGAPTDLVRDGSTETLDPVGLTGVAPGTSPAQAGRSKPYQTVAAPKLRTSERTLLPVGNGAPVAFAPLRPIYRPTGHQPATNGQ